MSVSPPWKSKRTGARYHTILDADGRPVAATVGGGHLNPYTQDEIEQHALLITEAPNLLEQLNQMVRAYVRLLESASDRIRDLGGDCDALDKMEADDPNLGAAKAAIANATGGSK